MAHLLGTPSFVLQFYQLLGADDGNAGSLLSLFTHQSDLFSCSLDSAQAHISIMEKGSDHQQALILGLQYLVNISYVEADEVLKICLDYWNLFVPDVYTTSQTTDVNAQFSFGPMHTVSFMLVCHLVKSWQLECSCRCNVAAA